MWKLLVGMAVWGLLQWGGGGLTLRIPSADVSFRYLVEYTGGARRHDRLPMLVALHGNGDTAENFQATALNEVSLPARLILVRGPRQYGGGQAWPRDGEEFSRYGPALHEAVTTAGGEGGGATEATPPLPWAQENQAAFDKIARWVHQWQHFE